MSVETDNSIKTKTIMMKASKGKWLLGLVVLLTMLTSCGSKKTIVTYTPEESGLNMVKITDESKNSVLASGQSRSILKYNFSNSTLAGSSKQRFMWGTTRTLSISPDGKRLAYMTLVNDKSNVMVRSTGSQGGATQRTFRNVLDFSWGADGKFYFSDINGENAYICSVGDGQGNMITQITNGTVYDKNPVSLDGRRIFFTRTNPKYGPSVWMLNREDGMLTSCATGYMPCLIPGNPDAFYCVRNSSNGRSEIWYVDYVKGQETLILTDENHSFSHPSLSPDGKWIVCQGSNRSSGKKGVINLDIYAVRIDGTDLTQLTYNTCSDTNPVFSPDGKYIYFISARGTKDDNYNVWRMTVRLD